MNQVRGLKHSENKHFSTVAGMVTIQDTHIYKQADLNGHRT